MVLGVVAVGIVRTEKLGPTVPTIGDKFAVGTAAAALTPRLPISVESNGIPDRAVPLDALGGAGIGDDDEAVLLEPAPHIPDNPDVSSIPEDVDAPDVAEIDVDVDVTGLTAVAGVVVPLANPPPS